MTKNAIVPGQAAPTRYARPSLTAVACALGMLPATFSAAGASAVIASPRNSRASVVQASISARPLPVFSAAGAAAVGFPGGLAPLSASPSLTAAPIPARTPLFMAPTPAAAAALVALPALIAAQPPVAGSSARPTGEGRAPGSLAAVHAKGVGALMEAFKEPGADTKSSRPEKLDAIYDGSAPMVKPAVDWWEVGGRRYESTTQLMRALPRLGKSREATYYYRHKNAVDPVEHRFNAVAGGVSAGLFGVASGALLWALGSFVSPIMGAVGGLTFSGAPGVLLFSGFFGAALGLVGLLAGAMEGGKPSSREVTGKLHVSGKSLRFIFKGDEVVSKTRIVNLNAYASARTPRSTPAHAPQTFLKGALKGLGMGLFVAVSLMIPLAQIVTIPLMGPAIGMDVGRRLSLRGHAVGGLLGGALGLLVPLSFFAALALGGAQNIALIAVWAGALGLIGTVLGVLLNNHLNRADAWAKVYAPENQWWNSAR